MTEVENVLGTMIKKDQMKQVLLYSGLGILIALVVAGSTFMVFNLSGNLSSNNTNDINERIYTGDLHLGNYINDHLDDVVKIWIASNTSGNYLSDTQIGVIITKGEEGWNATMRYWYWGNYPPDYDEELVTTTIQDEEVNNFFSALLTGLNSSSMNNVTMTPEKGYEIMINSYLEIAFFVFFDDFTGFNFEWMTYTNGTEFLGVRNFEWEWQYYPDPNQPRSMHIISSPDLIVDGKGSFLEPLSNFQIFFDSLGLFFVKYNPFTENT